MIAPRTELHQIERVPRRHRRFGDLGDQRHVLLGREARDQIVELEYESDMLAPVLRERRLVGARQVDVPVQHLPAGRHVETADDVEQRRLARAGWSEQHDEAAFVEQQVDLPQRVHLDLAHAVDLGQIADGEERSGHKCRPGLQTRRDRI